MKIQRVSCGLRGSVRIPGDKSCSQRALMLASQMLGETKISGLLESGDVMSTKNALIELGVDIKKQGSDWLVQGKGLASLRSPENVVDLGNSGTGVRLLMGLVSTLGVRVVFTGDESLRGRPMSRVIDPLRKFSTEFSLRDGNYLPIEVIGNDEAVAINHSIEVPSAQVKSALMLAAINAHGESSFVENVLTRDHTEIMMRYLGFSVSEEFAGKKKVIKVNANEDLPAKNIVVSGDPSSAAFLVAAALLVKDSDIIIENLLINPHRVGFYEVLKSMNANIEFLNEREESGEKVADIRVKYSKDLMGVDVSADIAPAMIDEYPILAVLASQAQGKTRMNGLEELKIKESNRLDAIVNNLKSCGVSVEAGDDWIEVTCSKNLCAKAKIKTNHDHRIAMSFIILGLINDGEIEIDDISMINTSFPEFFDKLKELGVDV